jgi:hypothetical protein
MAEAQPKAPVQAVGQAVPKRVEVPIRKAVGPGDDKVHTWPHLVRSEFLCAIFITMLLVVWSLLVDAPLEEPANPTRTPNPSKAPWYFGTSWGCRRCWCSSIRGTPASCCRA